MSIKKNDYYLIVRKSLNFFYFDQTKKYLHL
jgi:hypothetical protein